MKPKNHTKLGGKDATQSRASAAKAGNLSASQSAGAGPWRRGRRTDRIESGTLPSRRGIHPNPFPIVGVGASAGGLEAFTELLKSLPTDTGMGFVLVQHLDPQHESALAQLMSRVTSMPVREVTNNLRVEADHVYIIPPNTNLSIALGVLKLQPRQETGGAHRSIDFFFESLAEDQRERAIGVILSGTATDGTLGLEAIKAEGGITFAQDDTAKYDSMPRSAVAAGCVDFVLRPDDIAQELARIAKHPYLAGRIPDSLSAEGDRASATAHAKDESPLPSGGRGTPPIGAKQARAEAKEDSDKVGESGFKKILRLLGNHCGVDFSLYKSSTIQRRITRRMVLNKHDTLEQYGSFLQGNSRELDALYSDCLISVTSFFRNPEAFEVLKDRVFPKLIPRRSDDPFRVWVLGCSTGQEAYSIAMAFVEATEKLSRAPKLQVFATDLNEALLEKARHGLYAKSLAQDLPAERLRRFFVEEQEGYQVIKSLRGMVVFARQNLINDPPFSRLDLISCRNLLIYLEASLQRKVLPMFHYALKPEGFLFLGASESIGPFTDLFEPADKKHKIYSKKPAPGQSLHLPVKPEPGQQRAPARKPPVRFPQVKKQRAPEGFLTELDAQREADRLTVAQFAPAGVLINAGLQILQFRGPTGKYLEPPSGKASFDVLKMAREGLLLPLRAAINQAKKENKTARRENVRLQQNGRIRTVNVEVIPLKNLRERCYLVLFEDVEKPGPSIRSASRVEQRKPFPLNKRQESRQVMHLEHELSETRDYLQSIQEHHEAANEELQASNEEVQSANEELQSVNEELQTSKEELESANEELTTVNEEMASRNAELASLNADLVNLQSSTKLPILVIARDLTIRRFSAPAGKIFHLQASDRGRPIGGVRHNLEVRDLDKFVGEVVATGREQEREVRDRTGRWYSLRAEPYLTLDNKVDGAVLVLVDIDALKRTEREARAARDYAEATIRTARDPLIVLRADLRVNSANEAFYKTFHTTPAQTHGRLIYELGNHQWDIPKLRTLLEDILPRDSFFNDFEVMHDSPQLGRRTLLLNARRLDLEGDSAPLILLAIEDVSERQRADTASAALAAIVNHSDDAIIGKDLKGIITSWNKGAEQLFGYPAREAIGQSVTMLIPPEREHEEAEILERVKRGESVKHFQTVRVCKDSSRVEISLTISPIKDATGRVVGASKVARDITEHKRAEEALRRSEERYRNVLEEAVNERTAELTATNKQLEAFVYSIAHDLRAPLRSMQGFSAMLVQEEAARLSEKGQDFANRINRSAQFLDALLQDLLAFSRISQLRIDLIPVSLKESVLTVLSRLEKEISEKNARVVNLGPWPSVLAHKATLEQVLFNLISNSLKFMRLGVPPLIRLQTQAQDSFVRIWIEDNGIGIAPDHLEQIFRLFIRLHGQKYPGTGIGLAIVQKGVERMGGRIAVESTPGEGSRFWFELRKCELKTKG